MPISGKSARKGRVLFLSTSMGIGGGAEEQVILLALELARRGWETKIVSMLPPETAMPDALTASRIEIQHLGMTVGRPDPRAIFRLIRVLRDFQPDVLHTHMTHANLLGRFTRLFQRVPVLVSTLHGHRMFGVNSRFTALRELGHRLTDPLADMTTAICQAAADSYVQSNSAPRAKIVALPNGLDTAAYRPDPEVRERMRASLGLSGFNWLAVGRLESPKNYPLMLEAFARSGDGSTLLICGSGAMERGIRSRICELGLEHKVRLLGVRRDIPAVMNAADGFVLSSDTEGLPMVLLQAAASGLPIAATHVGGNAEIVEHGVTGFLTPPGEAGPLAATMQRIAASMDEAQRKAMGLAARDLAVSRYDLRIIADRWEQLYFDLLAYPTHIPKGTYQAHVGDIHTNQTCLRH